MNWLHDPSDQEPIDEATPLSPKPLDRETLVDPRPSFTANRENVKILVQQQVEENLQWHKDCNVILKREKEAIQKSIGLERRIGRLEREVEGWERRYQALEEELQRERDERDAANAAVKKRKCPLLSHLFQP